MGEYFKNHMGSILLSLTFLCVGLILGFSIDEGGDGVYLSAKYDNGEEMFVLGKSKYTISDFSQLSDSQAQIVFSEIEVLSAEDKLGKKLRKMAQYGDGPFSPISVAVNINLVEGADMPGPVAKACRNSPIYKNPIIAYELSGQNQENISINGMLGLNVTYEQIVDCDDDSQDSYEIWASREYVKGWIISEDFSSSTISVKARMIVSSVSI